MKGKIYNGLTIVSEDDLYVEALVHIVPDPVHEVADLSVDPRVEETPAADAPADNTSQVSLSVLAVTHHRTAGVSLTAVLPDLSGTDHRVRDGEGVLQPAGPVRHHRHRDLHQPVRAAGAARLEGPPARHRAGPLRRLLLGGQTHRSNVLVHLEWFRQLPDGDVVLVVLGPAVVLMDGEADHSPPLLGALVHTPVVLSGHNLHLVRGPVGAVCGRHHVARAED